MGVDLESGSVDHNEQRAVWVEPQVMSLKAGDAEEDGTAGSDSAFGKS